MTKSLAAIDRRFAATRYTLLETARQYARERLGERGEQELVAQRHACAVVAVAASIQHSRRNEPEVLWTALARAEQENVRAALQWALAEGHDVLAGHRILGSLHNHFWIPINAFGAEGCGRIVRAMELAGKQTPLDVLANLYYATAGVKSDRGDYEGELAASQRAAELYRAAGDAFMTARAQQTQALALEFLGRGGEAAAILNRPFFRSQIV